MLKMTSFAYFLENKLFFSFIFIVLQQMSLNFYSHFRLKKLIFSSSRLKFSIIKIKPPSLPLYSKKKEGCPSLCFLLNYVFSSKPNQGEQSLQVLLQG